MKNYPNVNKLFLKAGNNFESNGKVTSHSGTDYVAIFIPVEISTRYTEKFHAD